MSEVGNIEVSLILHGADSFEKDVKGAADSLGTISISLDKYQRAINSSGGGTQSFLSKMRDYTIVFGGVHNAIQMVTDAITSIPRSIIDNNAAIEKNKVLLAGLEKGVGSYAEAQKLASSEMKEVLSISKGMPYSIDAILDSYTKLRVGGVENTTVAMESLLNTAAKSGATSEQLKHASVALQQMAGKGVISMEELRGQLGEAIPDAMNIMSRAVGMDMATMVKVISTGSLEAKSALALFFDEMRKENDGAAYAMSTTWIGIVASIQKSWENLVTNGTDGSGMFSNMKGQLNEVNTLLKSNEAKRFVQDLDSSLSKAISGISSVAKYAYNNLEMITSAMIGLFAGSKLSSQIGTVYGAIRTQINETSQANSVARAKYADEIIKTKALIAQEAKAHVAMMGMNLNATQAEIAKEKELHAAKMAGYQAQVRAAAQASMNVARVNSLTAATNMLKTAVNGVVNAFGGWSTIAVTAIVGVIAYVVQANQKVKELNESLAKNKGYGATQEEMLFAKKKIDDYEKQVKLVRDLEAAQKNAGKLGGIQGYSQSNNPWYEQQLKAAKDNLALKEKTIELDRLTYKNAREDNDKQQRELATSRYNLEVESKLNDIQRTRTDLLDQQMKKNASIKDVNAQAKANAEARSAADLKALEEKKTAISSILSSYEQEMAKLSSTFDPSGKGVDMSKMTEVQREQFNRLAGVIELTKDKLRSLKEESSSALSPAVLLNGGGAKKEAADPGQKAEDGLDVQIAKLKEKYRALESNTDLETKSAEINARIANGEYKGKSPEFIAHLRALAKEYDVVNNQVRDFTQNQAEAKNVLEAIGNQQVSLRKKIAKASVDDSNPFLQWQKTSEAESAALDERINHLKEIGKYNDEARNEAKKASDLIVQLDQVNASEMITARDKALTRSLMSASQAAKAQHEEEMQQLVAFQAAVESMQDSPAKQKMLGQIDQVRTKMRAVYERDSDPFKKWLASAEDLNNGVRGQLVTTFDGLLDSVATKITDTTASMSDMIRSLADDLQKYVIKLAMINALKAAISGTSFGSSMFGSSSPAGATGTGGGGVTNFTDVSQSFQPTQFTGFANGGIMTPYGSLPLKKYANGGVATTPQVAVFAEAGMNEAYVPLPDGRTIPVTMTGSNQRQVPPIGVSVNVINQSGTQLSAEQASAPRFDGESYIVDVVLRNISRPGTLRTAIKGAK